MFHIKGTSLRSGRKNNRIRNTVPRSKFKLQVLNKLQADRRHVLRKVPQGNDLVYFNSNIKTISHL